MITARKLEPGSRTIVFGNLPPSYQMPGNEIHIDLRYAGNSNAGTGITLDHAVIPSILRAHELMTQLPNIIALCEEAQRNQESDAKDGVEGAAKELEETTALLAWFETFETLHT